MAVHYKAQCFVFGKENRHDADRVFKVFTNEFGKIEIFGKAIRKIASKLRGGIDIYSLSEIEFIQGKSKKTLTDAVFLEKFSNILKDPKKLVIANRISRVLESALKGQEKDEKIWNLVLWTFKKLKSCEFANLKLYYFFLWNFLAQLGYEPEVSKCAVCQKELNPDAVYFSHKEGGVVCKNCSKNAEKINCDVVKILRIILAKDWQTAERIKVCQASQRLFKDISRKYYFYILETFRLKP